MTDLAAEPVEMVVTQPGIYDAMPEDLYHADPVPAGSLSFSGARKLLPPSCPARFRYEREHPAPPTAAMELGTVAHQHILGAGADLEVVPFADWRTKAAQEQRDAARAKGRVPLLATDHARVLEMVAAIRSHPLASALFDPAKGGKPEQSAFWHDDEWGVWRRCRYDWLPAKSGRMVIPDLKTTQCADPSSIAKSVANYGYHMQEDFYLDGAASMFPGADLGFVFVFQETSPPYLVSVVQLDAEAVAIGRKRNQRALEIFRDCTASGLWPDYQPEGDITRIGLPRWARGDYL